MLVVLLATAGVASATPPLPETRCTRGRYDATSKYFACALKATGKSFGTSDGVGGDRYQAALAKCLAKLSGAWANLQLKFQGTGATCDGPRFLDNGDGTVTDHLTGLQWEQKTSDATIHDSTRDFAWTNFPLGTTSNGTLFALFLASLNGYGQPCFAGECDWRIPSRDELATTLLAGPPCPVTPCIDETLFGPSAIGAYWTATELEDTLAWVVSSGDGAALGATKTDGNFARGVRGGL